MTNAFTRATTTKVTIPPGNIKAIADLEPQALWSQFATLSSIPRPSKQEEAVLSYIKSFADERNLQWKQDAVGNLVVFHPGCGQGKDAPAIIIQGHVDMVTEKNNDSQHNFETDPILLRRFQLDNGENWLGAKGTTLGADNGIGVAAALTLLDTPLNEGDDHHAPLPPLEALFTVDEETGLTGAADLDATVLGLTGKTMLNLDTEEFGELYVGCAGGGHTTISFPFSRGDGCVNGEETPDVVELRVDGLMGGHSGINIHEGRANAVLLCAAAAQAALREEGVNLISITGGDKHNAIPREAKALLAISNPEKTMSVMERIVEDYSSAFKEEYGNLETNLCVRIINTDGDTKKTPLDPASASRLLSMLLALPHGPLKFSHVIPNLVETSNNVASVTISDDDDTATILCSTRSSISPALESTRNRIESIASLAGATAEKSAKYPGWNPDMRSSLLQLSRGIFKEKLSRDPGVKAIHAGLECGLLIEKLGGDVDALSFGPTIEGAHSPDERICIDTVEPFFELVRDILARLAAVR
eukprot:CAMPEP_0172497720 /NCGR_PEP_ID=MMETSP1066-20121228/104130_1 /TAXON_ID=671091 /ORGANISM="Coscinodiscus wailesii, Strain CCMP2513" /LENGTH=530 /DNA_ID=CAMNT_0013270651 /DNA_START=154 /DNA_END=1746 /DNA_ORIENTATION=+